MSETERKRETAAWKMFRWYQDEKVLCFGKCAWQEQTCTQEEQGTHLNLATELKGRKEKCVSGQTVKQGKQTGGTGFAAPTGSG